MIIRSRVKTRIQKQGPIEGMTGFQQIRQCASSIIQKEGYRAFYNGLTPRLMRVAPGQAITFMVYEKIRNLMTRYQDVDEPPESE